MGIRDTLARAKSAGRGGDSDIVHVNPQEEMLLHSMGGSGTINPRTGLREFYTDAFGGGYGNANAVDAGGTRGEVGFTSNSTHDAANAQGVSRNPAAFPPGTPLGVDGDGVYHDISGISSKQLGEMGLTPSGNAQASSQSQPTSATPEQMDNVSEINAATTDPKSYFAPTRDYNLQQQTNDYNNVGNTTADTIGNFLARMFGFNERDPSVKPSGDTSNIGDTEADWGFDPAGAIGGIAGAAGGIPGMGIVADVISQLLGRPLEMNMGPDVMKTLGLGDFGSNLVNSTGDFINSAVGPHTIDDFMNSQYGGAATGNGQQTFEPGQGGGGSYPNQVDPSQSANPGVTPPTGTGTDPGTGGTGGTGGTTTPPANPTRDQIIAQLRDLALINDAFAAQNRGLNPADYSQAFNSYLDNLTANIPASATDATTLGGYFPSTIGNTTLDNYQTQKRNEYTGALEGYGWDASMKGALGDTSDDAILQSIYDEQYNPAKQYVDYAHARGTLNDMGYNQALTSLGNQGTTAMSRLQDIGKSARTSDLSSLGDLSKGAFDKAGSYTLGQTFDPAKYNTDFGTALSGDVSNLAGSIRGSVPSSLFDTSSLLTDASRVQGATSGGGSGILDTLASRQVYNPYSARSRGLGTTGAF